MQNKAKDVENVSLRSVYSLKIIVKPFIECEGHHRCSWKICPPTVLYKLTMLASYTLHNKRESAL